MSRVVVVTGATGVAGRAVCTALRGTGATVVAVGTDAGRLAGVDADVRLVADLGDADATRALAETVTTNVGPVDSLVHLVGGWRGGRDDDDFAWLERQVLTTLRNASRAFHDDLTSSASGRLVIVSAVAAGKPTWSNANYATLKAAAETWVSAVASSWRKAGRAAAVSLVVSSIGEGGTDPARIADAVLEVERGDPATLNGARIDLVAPAADIPPATPGRLDP
ncbi:Acetoacetyl-CoA reductase [Frondihabitans sp. 762G35]|uniref:SDR family NAD(P)-dependent oxidoreductase n=1 Tax=Frondihabitans sp. 762G35 TaxID=1446794 RepID=UPI000D1FF526|nr:SDR family oxidoreductase [Frondihabitans sp. 762G35]ARC57868.1 Acetoacetyl-CoA reductase [Frondihabitans sp. 762G35]